MPPNNNNNKTTTAAADSLPRRSYCDHEHHCVCPWCGAAQPPLPRRVLAAAEAAAAAAASLAGGGAPADTQPAPQPQQTDHPTSDLPPSQPRFCSACGRPYLAAVRPYTRTTPLAHCPTCGRLVRLYNGRTVAPHPAAAPPTQPPTPCPHGNHSLLRPPEDLSAASSSSSSSKG